eukprot:sb/3475069/
MESILHLIGIRESELVLKDMPKLEEDEEDEDDRLFDPLLLRFLRFFFFFFFFNVQRKTLSRIAPAETKNRSRYKELLPPSLLKLSSHTSHSLTREQEPTETSKQPIRTRYLSQVTGYQPIRDQYSLIRSV